MIERSLLDNIKVFFTAYRATRDEILESKLGKKISELASRGMINSSLVGNSASQIYADELYERFCIAWDNIKELFIKNNMMFPKAEIEEITDEIKRLVNLEVEKLSSRAKSKRGPIGNHSKEIEHGLGMKRHQINSKLIAELIHFTKSEKLHDREDVNDIIENAYIDQKRIKDLETISTNKFDLTRLIQLCREINSSHRSKSYMSIAMAIRSIIDHVPPIFGFQTFNEVSNNYGGEKSFKRFNVAPK